MIYLAIQTALKHSEWAVLEDSQIRAEITTDGPVDELTALLEDLLQKAHTQREDIDAIVLVKGPGSFTSLRSGIAFGNALAYALKLPIYEMSTLELLRLKSANPASTQVLLWSGGLNAVLWNGSSWQEGSLAILLKDQPHKDLALVAELPESLQKELHSIALEKEWTVEIPQKTFATVLAELDLNSLEQVQSVEPWYLHPPKITVSSDPFKQ